MQIFSLEGRQITISTRMFYNIKIVISITRQNTKPLEKCVIKKARKAFDKEFNKNKKMRIY